MTIRTRTAVALAGWCLVACGGQSLPDVEGSGPDAGRVSPLGSANPAGQAGGPGTATVGADGTTAISNPGTSPSACVPGRSVGCACVNGRSGAQICSVEKTYGPCSCNEPEPAPAPYGVAPDGGATTVCPCTRRPGAGNALQCPVGVGQSASMIIGSSGGKLSLDGQQFRSTGVPFSILIPPTALDADTTITVTETSTPPPDNFVDYSPVYVVEPVALATAVAMPIVIGWANKDGLVEGPLAIYTAPSATGVFERIPDSYVNAGFMQGSTKGFGAFFVGYPKKLNQTSCP